MGFQDMPEVVRRAAQAKGGRVRTKKGFAAMSPEKRLAAQSKGGKAKYGNQSRKGAKQIEEGTGSNTHLLERILGNIDGDNDTRSNSESEK